MGQTFTVGVAGTLDRIDVLMFRLGGILDPTGNPVMRVFDTTGGLPSGTPLALVSTPENNVPLNVAGMVSFDVSAFAIVVNPGDVLAFSITAASGVGPYFLPTDQGQAIEYNGGAAIAKFGNNPFWTPAAPYSPRNRPGPYFHRSMPTILSMDSMPIRAMRLATNWSCWSRRRASGAHSSSPSCCKHLRKMLFTKA